ncbi:MAG: UvrD-helicase domain-containing protein, partial [Pseudolabrys sp.]|nr:UvrD-helicase domain-containing protein [Pseudolabrys sp.]
LVDEYQDTNVAQYLWLRLLSQTPASLPSPLGGEGAEPYSGEAGEGVSLEDTWDAPTPAAGGGGGGGGRG